MSRRAIQGARAIVTGASSGIGREIVCQLTSQGAKVVATARREDRLQRLCDRRATTRNATEGSRVVCVAGDITDPLLRERLLEVARSEMGGLDILVNNAGVGALGPFMEADAERLRRVMEVNFFAPLELIRLAVPLMRSGRRPIIANIGSVLGHRAVPGKSEYSASKFALHGFSDAFRAEMAREGIDVLLVSPSTTKSEFFDNVLEQKESQPRPPSTAVSAHRVAQQAVRAIRQGRHEIVLTLGGKLLVWSDRLCPALVNRLVARFG